MSVVGDVLDLLGQEVMPEVGSIVFPDLMDVIELTSSVDSGGAEIVTETTAYTNVPVAYKPTISGNRRPQADQLLSTQQYELTFPTHQSAARINFNIALHRLTVLTRGNEPEKVFRPVSVKEKSGVVYAVVCVREN